MSAPELKVGDIVRIGKGKVKWRIVWVYAATSDLFGKADLGRVDWDLGNVYRGEPNTRSAIDIARLVKVEQDPADQIVAIDPPADGLNL